MTGFSPESGSGQMFDGISRRYDFINDLLSVGLHRSWRRRAAAMLEIKGAQRVLDVGTGTGAFSRSLIKKHRDITVFGLDSATTMLAIASHKSEQWGQPSRYRLAEGDALHVPFPGASFDAVTMAFVLRNMPHRAAVFAEIHRVLRPGSQILILELLDPPGRFIGWLLRLYIRAIIPLLGGLASDWRAYRHLARSMAAFPKSAQVLQAMQETGFSTLKTATLGFGLCCIFLGRKGAARGEMP